MALMNRIRILNFSYNNHARLISDETFDLYGGENVLLNMKNGGGKSVLTQLVMQPIVPKVKLMKRTMEGFFAGKGRKSPAYVLLEWKLEDQGGYVLTGIAMDNAESRVRDQEDKVDRVKYFTFTVQYKDGHPFDLSSIPLTWEDQNGKYPVDFKTARTKIGQAGREDSGRVHVFSDREGQAYRNHLASFNIYQDEWKNLIREINESEGGLIEIFDKTKKSMDVLKDWMLPRVTEAIQKNTDDQAKLETMMENLVEEWIENEDYLQKKSVYQAFLEDIQDFGRSAEDLAGIMDQKTDTLCQLAGLHGYLALEVDKNNQAQAACQMRIKEIEGELNRIDHEEASYAYYKAVDEVEALEQIMEEKRSLAETKAKAYGQAETESREYRAADYLQQIDTARGQLLDVEARLKADQDDEDRAREKQNLGHSLLVGYRKQREGQQAELAELEQSMEANRQAMQAWEVHRQGLEDRKSELDGEVGRLKERRDYFLAREEDLAKALDFHYERNMLGEISDGYIQAFVQGLEKRKTDHLQEEKTCLEEQTKQKRLEEELEGRMESDRDRLDQAKLVRVDAEKALDDYVDREASLADIYMRNGRDFALRFHHESASEWMTGIYYDLDQELRACDFAIKQAGEESYALNHDRYHASAALIHWLEDREIEFQTGESYLKQLDKKNQIEMIDKHPLLPFGFVFEDTVFENILGELAGFIDRSVTPIFSYSSLGDRELASGSNGGWQLIAPCHEAALDRTRFPELLEALKEQKDMLQVQRDGFVQAADQARADLAEVQAFTFEEGTQGNLQVRLGQAQESVNDLNRSLAEAKEAAVTCRNRMIELVDKGHKLENLKMELERCERDFHAFLQLEKERADLAGLLADQESQLRQVSQELKSGHQAQQERNRLQMDSSQQVTELKRTVADLNQKIEVYRDYESGQLLEGRLDFLQSQWNAMVQKWDQAAKDLEKRRAGLIETIENRRRQLDTLGITRERLAELVYRPGDFDRINEQEARTKEESAAADKDLQAAILAWETQKVKVDMELAATRKFGQEVLAREKILSNFKARRAGARDRFKKEREVEKDLQAQMNGMDRLMVRIQDAVDLGAVGLVDAAKPERDPKATFETWKKKLEDLKDQVDVQDRVLMNRFDQINRTYCREDDRPKRMVQGIRAYMEKGARTYEDYFHMSEKLTVAIRKMHDLLRSFDQKLAGMEKNRENLIRQSYMQAKRSYEELQKIENHSKVALDGGGVRRMIRVNMAPMDESETENRSKMESYVGRQVEATKLEMDKGKTSVEIRKMIQRQMSPFELLGVLTDLSQFEVKAFKIDINKKNRRYKSWEDVVRQNSGGERFVSFFALLVALMSYTRASQRARDDYSRNRDTKVLIMDNPFGPITSSHLLEPLFQIAKQYRTQLICLTDIKTNAVWDCFKVIYVLKIRTNALRTKEYVKADLELRDPALESLEKAVFRSEETAQMRLDL